MSENPFKDIKKDVSKEDSNFSKQVPVLDKNKNKKTNKSFLGFFVGFLILAIFASVLLIFILIVGGPDNPLLDLLGIQAAQIQSSLLSITQTVFSIFSIGIFLVGAVFLFLGILKKDNDRSKFFISSGIFGGLLFLTVVIWLGLYSYISGFNFGLNVKAEIEVQFQDGSKDLSKITTPAVLSFSILNGILNEERLGKEVESIFWDFNDDGDFDYKGIEEKISHEFNTPGNKKIIAVLNFKDGTSQSYEKIFNIKDGSFGSSTDSGSAPLKVTFDVDNIVSNTKNTLSEFRWYFDGGENPDLITSSTIIEHIFKKVGKYNVVLVTVDVKNNIKKYNKTIEVLSGNGSNNLVSNISVFPGLKGETPFKVRLSGENSFSKRGVIKSYTWDFGNFEKTFSGKEIVKTFDEIGTYQVKLTIENEYGEKSFSKKTILVTRREELPIAKIGTNLEMKKDEDFYSFSVPLNVEFDGSLSTDKNDDIVEYSWDFNGDLVPDAFGEIVEKNFRDSGDYNVILTVKDSKGNKSDKTIKLVGRESVKALISTDVDSGVAPLVVLFDASFSRVDPGDRIVNYSWDFGDGSVSEFSSAQKRHKFENPGVYDVYLKISTEKGKIYKSTKKIFTREESVQACFTVSKSETTIDSEILFSSQCSSGEIKSWNWDFGDGKISYERNPIHMFNKTGDYNVILQITDYKNNVSEFRKDVKIN